MYRPSRGLLLTATLLAMVSAAAYFLLTCDSRRMQYLQSKADYPQLRSECMKLMSLYRAGGEPILIPGDDASRLPPTIRSLEPSHVSIDATTVTIECGGGFQHFGLIAVSPGRSPTP